MSTRNFEALFNPQSVALFGASNRPRSVGATVMRNLLAGGFAGPILPVNPKHKAVAGVLAYPNVASLPLTPDLAVICTPPRTVPGLVTELGRRGTQAAVVITAGLDQERDPQGQTLQQATRAAARAYGVRLLGPNCVGLLVPGIGLNASFAHTQPLPGNIAFVTQSGALATVVLDWAKADGIGFSSFISLGNSVDIDFGDVLEYLGRDPATQAVLLYIESIRDAPKFMKAAQAAARTKPIIAVKAGRVNEGAQAAFSHTGALAGADDVFEAALRRAGILRVDTIEDLFNAVATLARTRPLQGERLAIFTNGGGPGVMATDALILRGGELASLSPATLERLDGFLPANWSHGNPVDIIGDALPPRYVQTLQALLDDPGADAVLFIHSPSAIVPSHEIASELAPTIQAAQRNVLTCWLGRESTAAARHICAEAGIPTYDSPEDAVDAFLQMVHYRRTQALLLEETRPSAPAAGASDAEQARAVIEGVLKTGRDLLTELEAKAVLDAYHIPTVTTRFARTPDECAALAAEMGGPLALKIVSPEITHKSDVGGVVLDLETPAAVRAAAVAMQCRVGAARPDAMITGFSVQTMARRPHAHELIIGVATDPIFGPVILFGQGGGAVEVIGDRAVALPPLDRGGVRDLVARTRVARLLAGYRNQPPADMVAIYSTLLKVAQMIADLPEIYELDINPLLADDQGVLALDARLRVRPKLPTARNLIVPPKITDKRKGAAHYRRRVENADRSFQ
ncbi:MAG: acetate--CoA ligase family protein [Caldilineaceae bacterium]|nr:acetate--CoA ligase family protein [Caldilineaceae bacterium]